MLSRHAHPLLTHPLLFCATLSEALPVCALTHSFLIHAYNDSDRDSDDRDTW